MIMKIGIVGPRASIEGIHSMIHVEDAFIECIEYPCSLNSVVEILNNIQKELDGIIFTSTRYFNFACRYVSASIPWTNMKRSMASVLCALFEAKLSGMDIKRITFDLHDTTLEQMLDILCEKIGLDRDKIALYRYNDTQQYRDYMNAGDRPGQYAEGASKFHIDNILEGRANTCLTDSPSVAVAMKKLGYSVFLTKITSEDIMSALNTLRFRCYVYEQQKKDEYLEAVVSLTTHLAETNGDGFREYRQIQSVCQIETIMLTFAQSIGASVEKQSDMKYIVYSTKRELDIYTCHFEKLDFAETLISIADVERISMGIGFGVTHSMAKANAQKANRSAVQQQYSCYYIMDSDRLLQGPFLIKPRSSTKDFNKTILEQISLDTNVGITVLNKLAQTQLQYGFQSVTSAELAQMTGLSLNNIHRIVARLEEKRYAEIIGEKSYARTGRPRRLIRFNFGLAMLDNQNG